MARIEVDPNYSSPTFSRATAATDPFKKEDVQGVAAALSTHVHDGVHGLAIAPPAGSVNGSVITDGTITSAKIANGTIVAADIASGTITSNEIADGTIATADLANASVTNAKLASDTARANLLTNGGFEIWQRGNGPFTTNGMFTADRWQLVILGTDALSVSRDTANADVGSTACAACTYTLGNSNSYFISHNTDPQLRGRTLTASIRLKTATASAARLVAFSDGSGAAQVAGTTHTGGGVYQTLTVTYTVPGDATYVEISVRFLASCIAYIDNAMLVVGSQAPDYAPLHPADDLARCLRYYEVVGGAAGGYPSVLANASAANWSFSAAIGWKAIKAITPTTTKNGTWSATNCAQPLVDRATTQGCRLMITSSGVGGLESFPADATCTITVESNP